MQTLIQKNRTADLVVVGGGLSGTCCALTAARQGLRVVLIQDRPVLGGNASSEVRLWVLGATSHMGNNNRWAREGGVIDEILVENMWRNPEGNAVIFDSILLEMAALESGIELLLNTAVYELGMTDGRIDHVRGFCSQNQILYLVAAPLFVDASGDGILGFLAGADFRMGAEARAEHGELLAPDKANQALLGHSLYFYSRDTGQPVRYVPPAFALMDIRQIPRFRELRISDSGCRLWWLEYGGNLDTIHSTEEIKWELWRVAYGVWNYIKNSGNFPGAETLTLEWMGTIPGKRESRRFLGDTILTQNDVVQQTTHADAVSFGGWAIDLHPSDGVFSEQPGCTQWHAKGVYQIPFSTMYSRNVPNLFLTGRLISATHIAFGSTRVMATCAHNGQAVGMAATLCTEQALLPRDLMGPERMNQLQQRLLRTGQHIPGVRGCDGNDLALGAQAAASSTLTVAELPSSRELAAENLPLALLLPLPAGPVPTFTLTVDVTVSTTLCAELWGSLLMGNTTPDRHFATVEVQLNPGVRQQVALVFPCLLDEAAHRFIIIQPFPGGRLHQSTLQLPGILTLSQKMNASVAKSTVQTPPLGSGIDSFAFWLPDRRPAARNLALAFDPPLACYAASNVLNGYSRPWCGTNAWVPESDDPSPKLTLSWETPQTVRSVEMFFDTDFDHPMESVLMTHPEHIMPSCITAFQLFDENGRLLAEVKENHQTHVVVTLPHAVTLSSLSVHVLAHGPAAPALFEIRCY